MNGLRLVVEPVEGVFSAVPLVTDQSAAPGRHCQRADGLPVVPVSRREASGREHGSQNDVGGLMNERMHLESEKPAFSRLSKVGSILARKPHSPMAQRMTDRYGQRIDDVEPHVAVGKHAQGGGADQPAEPANPLLIAGRSGKAAGAFPATS